ncbi:alcohol dehydrogenase GroES-like domain-containing protein [Zalerion maritima]|uniref:Alcohol dehydrogenase GroES-like domain-containing protein n=1 Tax=Zalerion maritima TaxID=339359 RepID=A0AAD5RM39_9PEZI|nr:alcohol dehydrogenase GroES-like domain-containing protein [Zalerion maritima]
MSPTLPSTYKAAVFEAAGKPLTLKSLPMQKPGPNEVLIKVLACGVCHTDIHIGDGQFGDVFPRVPGHEMVGDVVSVGSSCVRFKGGERVGGAYHGGHDGTCKACLTGDTQMCDNQAVNGLTREGGYAEYCLLREEAVVRVSKDLDVAAVAPILCAGLTVYNGMRNLDVRAGSLVAIQGLGGLGHLAVQYAAKMGYHVVAISSGDAKRKFAKELGAHEYIDTSKEDPARKLQEMGGAKMIVATAPSPKAVSPLVNGLGVRGKLLSLPPMGPMPVDTVHMVIKGASVHGWAVGSPVDCEETLEFTALTGIECMIEKFKLDDVHKAVEKLQKGEIRFRGVLLMD